MFTRPSATLTELVARQKAGHAAGIASVCSAHPTVLEAACAHACAANRPVLVESTCNQVNHRGGYTGLTPRDFAAYARRIAATAGLPVERLLLGGDHLGPSPWQELPAQMALGEALLLVAADVQSGYTKIHLDASMRLGGDPDPLPLELAAARTADLAAAAEANRPAGASAPVYVIGTEVPVPGGALDHDSPPAVSRPTDVAATLEATRAAFMRRGLDDAWLRVIAVVVQPGVEYGDERVFDYDRAVAEGLSRFIEGQPALLYEAHSTDYQTGVALRALVEDHFAILKVGPALTFAYREAVFGLEMIEQEWLGGQPSFEPSRVRTTLDAAMRANPVYWRKYYGDDPAEQALKRAFSFSDRVRYYWPAPEVSAAVARLLANLARPVPLSLLSQYLPVQYTLVRDGRLANAAPALLRAAVTAVLETYAAATHPLA